MRETLRARASAVRVARKVNVLPGSGLTELTSTSHCEKPNRVGPGTCSTLCPWGWAHPSRGAARASPSVSASFPSAGGDKLVLRLGDADGGLPATGFRYRRLRRPDQDHSAPASAIFDVAHEARDYRALFMTLMNTRTVHELFVCSFMAVAAPAFCS